MRYVDYLENVSPDTCPFCHPEDRKFIENETAYLTYALAPYHRHHLLIIPKEHKLSFLDLTEAERKNIEELTRKGAHVLSGLKYENFTLMVREGKGGAKSVEHLHYHLIPNTRLGDLDHDNNQRLVLSEEEVYAVSAEIQNIVDSL